MVISRMHNGLGNQMFQYAHAMSVAKKFNLELKLDLSWFLLNEEEERPFRLSEFEGFRWTQATEGELAFFDSRKGKLLNWWNKFLVRRWLKPIDKVCLGSPRLRFYQGERFFKGFESSVIGCFRFPPLQSEAGRRTAALIRRQPEAVALHVRRGDYLWNRNKSNIVTSAYYIKAMEFLGTKVLNPSYFVFSDDILFCKNFFHGENIYFVEGCASEIEEMHLMTLCHHSIIANSTFSWWGAWLGDNKRFVVAPYKWYSKERRNAQSRRDGLFPSAWHLLRF